MSTAVEQLRNEWSSFLKWTASVSIFFITASLTFLTFQINVVKRCLDTLNKTFLYATLTLCIINIVLVWILLSLHIFRVLKTYADLPYITGPSEKQKRLEGFNQAIAIAKPLQLIMVICFLIIFFCFLAFIWSFIG